MEKVEKYIITAIQVAKGKIKISYDASGNMGKESYTLISAEKARPEFYKAMLDLRSHVASLLEIDFQGMDDRIKPRVVKFDYDSNDRMSAIIEADLKVSTSNGFRPDSKRRKNSSQLIRKLTPTKPYSCLRRRLINSICSRAKLSFLLTESVLKNDFSEMQNRKQRPSGDTSGWAIYLKEDED